MMLEEIQEAEVVSTPTEVVESEPTPTIAPVEQQKKELEEAGVKTLGFAKDVDGNDVVLVDPNSPNISTVGAGMEQDTLPIPARIKQLMKYEKIPRYAMTSEQKQTLADWRAHQADRVQVTPEIIETATPFTPAADPAPVAESASVKTAAKKKRKTTKKKA